MTLSLKKIRYRLEWIGLIAIAKIVPLFSRRSCYRISQCIGACAAIVDRPGRRIALSNLEAALGDQLSPRRRASIVRESYQRFIGAMLDLFWSPRITKQNFAEWIEVVGLDEVLNDIGPGRGIIFTTFHYGNFEWAALVMGLRGLHGMTLTQQFKNPLLEPVFAKVRKHSGNELASREGGTIRMYKALKRGRHVAILTDLTLKPWDPSAVIDCFGMKKCVTYAHAWLHQRTGAPIVPIYCQPLPDGKYRIQVYPQLRFEKGTSIIQMTQKFWDQIEPLVRQNPSPWVWMYKHWRYRLAGSAKPYPFYAEIGPKFEARLNENMAKLEREVVR
jgi:Kdo2-lipid IVA lauroyltransferase/acyltransferase